MANWLRNNFLARAARHVPGLKHIPIFKLLALAEIAILAKNHLYRLEPDERRRLFQLVSTSRGRAGNLSETERKDLAALVAKMEPRMFAGESAGRLSPFPLPRRLTHGPKHLREQYEREMREREEREQQREAPPPADRAETS